MEMKLLKLQVSSDILSRMGHPRIFEYISMVEVQNILQYDVNNLFLQAKLVLKEELNMNFRLIEDYETIRFLYVLKIIGNEILCLMSITTPTPFWPELDDTTPWAVIPPIILDPESIHFTFIISEKTIKKLDQFLTRHAESYQILAIENMNRNVSEDSILIPKFTNRQNEISRYAYRNGYFNSPKDISAEEIAAHYNLSTSSVTKHLRLATEKAMNHFFS